MLNCKKIEANFLLKVTIKRFPRRFHGNRSRFYPYFVIFSPEIGNLDDFSRIFRGNFDLP